METRDACAYRDVVLLPHIKCHTLIDTAMSCYSLLGTVSVAFRCGQARLRLILFSIPRLEEVRQSISKLSGSCCSDILIFPVPRVPQYSFLERSRSEEKRGVRVSRDVCSAKGV